MFKDKAWMQRLAIGICTMVIGSFIFFQTKDFTMFLAVAIGIYAVVNGIVVLVTSIKTNLSDKIKKGLVIRGAISLGIGALALLLPIVFAKITWTIAIYILAVQLLAAAGLQIYLSIQMKKVDYPILGSIIEIVISLMLAFLIFTMPQEIGMTIIRVAGIIIFAYGLLLVVKAIQTHLASDETV